MKKLLTVAMSFMLAVSMFAQKDVTKFLGIPVDGTKAEMIRKLKAKGFRSTSYDRSILEGEFNGYDVYIHIVTNNNRVWRIMVADATLVGESDIKIRFNKLCRQFSNNDKYLRTSQDYTIPDDENLLYSTILNKRYQASYYQKDINRDVTKPESLKKNVWFMIDDHYGQYQILMYYDNLYNQANGEDL